MNIAGREQFAKRSCDAGKEIEAISVSFIESLAM